LVVCGGGETWVGLLDVESGGSAGVVIWVGDVGR